MARKNRRSFPTAAGIFVILAAVLVLAGIIIWNKSDKEENIKEDAVLIIDNEPVSSEEYLLIAESLCNQIYMQYSTEEVNQNDFWKTEINGMTPWEQLHELVQEELEYNYALRHYAIELGITEPYSYEDLCDEGEKENRFREDASESGSETVYGLKEYDSQSYYQYWYSDLETQVTSALIKDCVEVDEQDCRNYYEENQEEYVYETGVEILYAEIPNTAENPRYTEAMANTIVKSMQEGASAKDLEESYPEAEIQELALNSFDTGEEKNGMYALRWQYASQMAVGEIYGPYEEEDMMCIMKCTGRTDGDKVDFDEVKERIERYLQVSGAEKLIEKEAKSMDIRSGGISAEDIICNIC